MSKVVENETKDKYFPVQIEHNGILGGVKEEPHENLMIEVNKFQMFKTEGGFS